MKCAYVIFPLLFLCLQGYLILANEVLANVELDHAARSAEHSPDPTARLQQQGQQQTGADDGVDRGIDSGVADLLGSPKHSDQSPLPDQAQPGSSRSSASPSIQITPTDSYPSSVSPSSGSSSDRPASLEMASSTQYLRSMSHDFLSSSVPPVSCFSHTCLVNIVCSTLFENF